MINIRPARRVTEDQGDFISDIAAFRMLLASSRLTARMSIGFIDSLEAINVGEHEGTWRAVAAAKRQCLLQPVLQQQSIGQPAQLIKTRREIEAVPRYPQVLLPLKPFLPDKQDSMQGRFRCQLCVRR